MKTSAIANALYFKWYQYFLFDFVLARCAYHNGLVTNAGRVMQLK
jgi:hypothetical protein